MTSIRKVESVTDESSGLYMSKSGDWEKLSLLIAQGWDVSTVDKHGSGPLSWAAGAGHLEVCKGLVKLGVDVDHANKTNRTPLHWAARNDQLHVVKWLIQVGADISLTTKDGNNAFHWAIWGGSLEAASWLLDNTALTLHSRNLFGCGAVHWAAATGKIEICQWLNGLGADFTILNNVGHGALNKASWRGHYDLCVWLLAECDLSWQCQIQDKEGRTAADLADLGGHPHVASMLRSVSVEPRPSADTPSACHLHTHPTSTLIPI